MPRALNSNAFGSGPLSQQPPPNQQSPSNQPPKQRVFTGTVTKVHDNFGFVDEDVFFQMRYILNFCLELCFNVKAIIFNLCSYVNDESFSWLLSVLIVLFLLTLILFSVVVSRVQTHPLETVSLWRLHTTQICLLNGMRLDFKSFLCKDKARVQPQWHVKAFLMLQTITAQFHHQVCSVPIHNLPSDNSCVYFGHYIAFSTLRCRSYK